MLLGGTPPLQGVEPASRPTGDFCGGNPPACLPQPHPCPGPPEGLTLLSGLRGRRGLLLPLAPSSSPGWKALLLSVSPGTSEMGTDTDNEINQQLQDRLNQDEVATDPLAEKLESGLRGAVPPAPTITLGSYGGTE